MIKNYRPVKFLPIFGKICERIIYNFLFNYFLINKLFILSQSGFLPGDSCAVQILSIILGIQIVFDKNTTIEVRGVFLDNSKVFDKVWQDVLIFHLRLYAVEGELLSLLKNYHENRQQRVALNSQTSGWRKINSGVPQGLVLGPPLFLI